MIFILPTNTCFWIGCFVNDISSYKKIYTIKWRDFKKPMAIFLDNFEKLQKIASLTEEQINFLKKYERPWTILVDKTKIQDKKLLKKSELLPNAQEYKKLAFRLAHNFMHWKLINKWWYFFLTSANKSWENETKSSKEVRKLFQNEINNGILKVFAHEDFSISWEYYFSDIFEFENNTTKVKYYRKN